MTASAAEIELVLPVEPDSVTQARRKLSSLAAKLGASREDVALAVSEAVANAVVHGYRGREGGEIRVRARREQSALAITISDDGTGMLPDVESPGLGVGIPLISKLAEDVSFNSDDNGTTVSMSFPIRQPASAIAEADAPEEIR